MTFFLRWYWRLRNLWWDSQQTWVSQQTVLKYRCREWE